MTAPRAKLSWSDLAGARVGLWGLGREGHANLPNRLRPIVETALGGDRAEAVERLGDLRVVLATSGISARSSMTFASSPAELMKKTNPNPLISDPFYSNQSLQSNGKA